MFVEYGYRSTNNGTYFSAMKWTADVFNIGYQETYSLDTAIKLLKNNHYVIVSCNEGLFTYGGHFVVLVGINGNTLKIYDPYLYSGKFDVSSRRGKATVKGNTVYVTINNFRKYANATRYYCYKNDNKNNSGGETDVTITDNVNPIVDKVNYKVKITANSGLNMRNGASLSYRAIGSYSKNEVVTITAKKGNWGKTKDGWISLDYTSKINENSESSSSSSSNNNLSGNNKYTIGRYKVNCDVLTVRNGPGTNYKWKEFNNLTSNAKTQNRDKSKVEVNGLVRGVECDITSVSGNWGKIPSGWICLDYCKKV